MIGGPTVDLHGNFVGMNFYDLKGVRTPFLLCDVIRDVLAYFNTKQYVSSSFWVLETCHLKFFRIKDVCTFCDACIVSLRILLKQVESSIILAIFSLVCLSGLLLKLAVMLINLVSLTGLLLEMRVFVPTGILNF